LVGAALWLLLVPGPAQRADRWAWLGLALTCVAAVLLVAAYEAAYVQATGESFVQFYRSNRLGVSMRLTGSGIVWHSLRNVAFYVLRILWFAAPWSLVAVAVTWRWIRSRMSLIGSSQREDATSASPIFTPTSARVVSWALAITAVHIIVLSPALVRAERFIFPIYFVIAAVGVIATLRWSPRFRDLATRADRYPWLPVAIWFGGILTRVLPHFVR
jgi:hypothetical protein